VAQNNLGVALYQQTKAEKAIEHLQIAVTLDPGSVEALLNLGNAYLAAGNSASAAKAYRRAYELDADQLDALALWAGIALNTGQVDQAKAAWEEVLAAMPEHELAHKGLGAIAVLESDPIQALPHLVAAKEINPRDATVRFYLGLAWEILGRQEEAAVEYEQALALSNDQALLSLVEAHLRALHQP
jgi:tetratricopeptide (TPR) repeat protein